MNVKQCPMCKKFNIQFSVLGPQLHHVGTEVWLSAYCPDCGYSWTIIYTPDRIEDRG